MGERRFRVPAQAERAHGPVEIERPGPEHLRQPPRGDAPLHLHLPEPVLGMHEAEGEIGVGHRLRLDMRNAVAVAHDLDLGTRADQPERAGGTGQGLLQDEPAAAGDRHDRHQKPEKNAAHPDHRQAA